MDERARPLPDETDFAGRRAADSRARQRRRRILLCIALLLLLLLLCGMVYLLTRIVGLPQHRKVVAGTRGVQVVFAAYAWGPGPEQRLTKPPGVAYDPRNKRIYVTDTMSARVIVFDSRGRNGRVFAEGEPKAKRQDLGEATLFRPLGIDVGDDGTVYVCDPEKAAVSAFSPEGEKVDEFRLMHPRYVAVHGERLYVLTKGSLLVLDTAGNEVGRYGEFGRGPDQLVWPAGVSVGADGTILIADTNNYRIVALGRDLKRKWVYGEPAFDREQQSKRQLASPMGVTFDGRGHAWLVDGLNSHIRAFTPDGKPYGSPVGQAGDLEDEFYYPLGIDWMEDDLFVLADRFHDRIVGVRLDPEAEPEE
ncbi:MAG: SMP-30/gluconolactonase/LRE family protein [Coriobacteriia bacterium]|nr:SMP-30/gluconolactonase/LRE family protein [Coriobacteriia bacterium]